MAVYKALTDYLPKFENDHRGAWAVDRSFGCCTAEGNRFIRTVQSFMDEHPEYELNQYQRILEANGLEWGTKSMKGAEVSILDGNCVMALIIGAIRANRFSTGALLDFFESGAIERWLLRLKEIDENMRKRIESEARAIVPITNSTLVCKDCVQRFDDSLICGNVSRCEAFPTSKPNGVLLGGECAEYVKE